MDGGPSKTLLSNSKGENLYGIGWSRRSASIFLRKRKEETGKYELWIIPVNGETPIKTDLSMTMIHSLSVNPDGEAIAFTAGSSSKDEIWVMDNYRPWEDKK